MKNTNVLIKLIAAILVVGLTAVLFAGCKQSQEVVMSFEKDGKTYTITEEEFSLLMKVRKRLFFCNLLYTTSKDTASFWSSASSEEGKTNEQYYKGLVMDQVKAVLVEKYLFESLGLTLSQDTLDSYKPSIKSAEKNYGGKGAYKQYFGYTATAYYDIYENMVDKSEELLKHLTAEGALLEVKDEDLDKYYKDHYVGYQYIVLDLKNKVVRDEEGNRVVVKEKDKDGKEVDGDSYKTEELTKEEKETKQTLADSILDVLSKGEKTFEELIQEYSDEYYSVEYPEGWFVDKDSTFINATVTEKVKDLEIGQHTAKVIESGDYRYIVKRVELKEKVYDDDDYLEFFADFEDTVEYDKYETYVKSFFEDIQVVDEIVNSYTMEETFLSPYVDEYYRNILYYYYGISF
ncbi:MAG: hypothetical protein E7603_01925 [Ruminococcaceae bacterium]|nr:hypothetical protein [Oscillospiraceae bacterium]